MRTYAEWGGAGMLDACVRIGATAVVVSLLAGAVFADLEEGLVLHYTFDGATGTNVVDVSGHGHDGYMTPDVTYVEGRFGTAPRFTSRDAYVTCDAAGLDCRGWTGVTVSAWIMLKDYTTYGTVISRGTAGRTAPWYDLRVGGVSGGSWVGGRFVASATEGSVAARSATFATGVSPPPARDTWYHVVATYSNGIARFYVDGALDGEGVQVGLSSLVDETGSRLVIGNAAYNRMTWPDAYFDGVVDEVRVYDRALSDEEVRQAYEALAGGAPARCVFEIDGEPMAAGLPLPQGYGKHWPFVGALVTNAVESPVTVAAGTRYVCKGWIGTGSVPPTGATTRVSFTIATNSSLTWLWGPEYFLDTEAGAGGSVVTADGWYADGAAVTVTATAAAGYVFSAWSGDVPAGHQADNPLALTMDAPHRVTATFAYVSEEPGLMLHYTFDNCSGTNVWDVSGNRNHGYATGGLTYVPSITGLAARVSNKYTYIVCPSPALDMSGWTGLTVSAWVQMEGYTTYGEVLTTGNRADTYGGCYLNVGGVYGGRWQPGFFNAYTNFNPNGRSEAASSTFAAGKTPFPATGRWYHLVGTFDGVQAKYYINGQLDGASSMAAVAGTLRSLDHSELIIGSDAAYRLNWNDAYFKGLIDEVKVYNRGLGTDEVRAMYEAVVGPPPATNQLVLHYTFDEFDGTNVIDHSGMGNNGVVHGATPVIDGALNAAYDFDGINDYIDCGTGDSLQITGDLTYSLWIRSAAWPEKHAALLARKEGVTSTEVGTVLALNATLDTPYFAVCRGMTGDYAQYASATSQEHRVSDGVWHQIVGVYEAGQAISLYHDGVLVARNTNAVYASLNAHRLPLRIGWKDPASAATYAYFRGQLDDVRIYDGALTPDAIAALYAERPAVTATHATAAPYCVSPSATNLCRFACPSDRTLLSLTWDLQLPDGWELERTWGDGGPEIRGDSIVFVAGWTNSSISFGYAVSIPAGEDADREIRATATYALDGMVNPASLAVQPDPLIMRAKGYHDADYQDPRWVIDNHEVSRVLSYWRAAGYRPEPLGYDGFAATLTPYEPLPGDTPHDADYAAPFWHLDGLETARVLAYWRAGGYHVDPAGFDGYAPGASSGAGARSTGQAPVCVADVAASGPAGYDPGGLVTVTNEYSYEGGLLSLCVRPALPDGWTVVSVAGDGSPELYAGEILWTGVLPASPVRLTYEVQASACSFGMRRVAGLVAAYVEGAPNPELIEMPALVMAMTPRDEDHDALPDGWEALHDDGGTGLRPGDDDDGDGANNFEECVAGTDPHDRDSVLKAGPPRLPGRTGIDISWRSEADRTYVLSGTTNLFVPFGPLVTGIVATPPINRIELGREAVRRFYRIEVE